MSIVSLPGTYQPAALSDYFQGEVVANKVSQAMLIVVDDDGHIEIMWTTMHVKDVAWIGAHVQQLVHEQLDVARID